MLVDLVTPVVDNHVASAVRVFDVSLSHLERDQEEQLRQLLVRFAEVFSDEPEKTDLVKNTIGLKEGVVPVAQAPFRLNPDKLKIIDKEFLKVYWRKG